MKPYLVLVAYSLLIAAGSLLGGWVPIWVRMTHVRMQVVLSFVGGLMLGIGMLHLLPHAAEVSNSLHLVVSCTLGGLLFTFFLIRTFHFHQHGPVTHAAAANATIEPGGLHPLSSPGEPEELPAGAAKSAVACNHPPHPPHPPYSHSHGDDQMDVHQFSWAGVMFGLSVHTMIDGIALGAAVMSDFTAGKAHFLGLGVFIAILLHKPLDALSITSLMTAAGWPSTHRTVVNLGFAMMCPLGAALVVFQMNQMQAHQQLILGGILGFSAGVFLCISLSDLLPEVQFHQHDRLKLSVALLMGVALAVIVGWIDPAHSHQLNVELFPPGPT